MLYDRSDVDLAVHQGIDAPGKLSENLEISLIDRRARYSLRAKPDAAEQLRTLVGLHLPSTINQSLVDEAIQIFCLGPDEWLLISDDGADLDVRFEASDGKDSTAPFSLVDVSHRNVALQIQGSDAEKALKAGCPLDLDLAHFPVGKVTRTVFERTEIILYRQSSEQFVIEVWRSFAPYTIALIGKAARSL